MAAKTKKDDEFDVIGEDEFDVVAEAQPDPGANPTNDPRYGEYDPKPVGPAMDVNEGVTKDQGAFQAFVQGLIDNPTFGLGSRVVAPAIKSATTGVPFTDAVVQASAEAERAERQHPFANLVGQLAPITPGAAKSAVGATVDAGKSVLSKAATKLGTTMPSTRKLVGGTIGAAAALPTMNPTAIAAGAYGGAKALDGLGKIAFSRHMTKQNALAPKVSNILSASGKPFVTEAATAAKPATNMERVNKLIEVIQNRPQVGSSTAAVTGASQVSQAYQKGKAQGASEHNEQMKTNPDYNEAYRKSDGN